jgi:sigma-B regulation protein RsbU (phosphoserine phosphatase)
MTATRRALVYGLLAAAGGYVLAATLEAAVIRSLQPTEWELAWVSDVALAGAFGAAMYLWIHLLTTRTALADRERSELVLQTQLSLAADIQRRLLPELPPPTSGLDCAAALRSAGKIGGDFYDFVQVDDDLWLVFVGDVSGKGIPAAMALGTLRSTFRALARQRLRPSEIASHLSAEFLQDWRGALYVTAIILEFDMRARAMTYTNAGHPRGLLLGRTGGWHLDRGGPPVGLFPDPRFEQQTLSVRRGDTCLLVTDGVTEAMENVEALEAGFRLRHDSARSAAELCQWVMTQALAGQGRPGDPSWDDDRTVVVVKFARGARVAASAPRVSAFRRAPRDVRL